jgi:hypothetical protein
MKLTRQQLEKIKSTIDYIINKYDEFADYSEDIELKEEDIDEFVERDYEVPGFPFPGEQDNTEVSTEYFLQIADEIPTIQLINNSIVKTEHYRYYIVDATDTNQEYFLRNYHNFKLKLNEKIEIDLVSENFIVGLAATGTGEYDNDYYGTISPYSAIEIKYNTKDAILDTEKELELVKAYIFEIADSTGLALTFSEIRNPVYDYEDIQEEAESQQGNKLREIESYNEGMRLFVSAIQIQEEELKFLNFYKILEHFAPIAVNIEANELMRKKLDAPKCQFENGDFIRSIFDLAKSMREKFNDEDLIKSTFLNCFDFVGLFEILPDSIKTKVKKQINEKHIDYSIDKQKITTASNMVGKIIYSTRNKVVHAKANFETTGNECDVSDLYRLNEFMKEACSQTIRWYNRQPQHLKLEIIK